MSGKFLPLRHYGAKGNEMRLGSRRSREETRIES